MNSIKKGSGAFAPGPASSEALLAVRGLCRYFGGGGPFGGGRAVVRAVENVSLELFSGETLGIVGESGCGKSTLGRMTAGLLRPSGGEVYIQGRPLWNAKAHADYRAFRKSLAGLLQMVFQDPHSSLNPRMRIGQSIAEPLLCSSVRPGGRADVKKRVEELLQSVGLDPDAAGRYPHEFSGGQRQRIAIARALATRPAFVVCDEPTSSLDASVQSQVLNLLRDMQDEMGLGYLFISHDLAVVRHMSDRVAVMYLGHVVESGGAEELFASPLHPYTRLLLETGPESDRGEELAAASDGAQGCPFVPRCPERMARCFSGLPDLTRPHAPSGAAASSEPVSVPVPVSGELSGLPPKPGEGERLVRCFLYSP